MFILRNALSSRYLDLSTDASYTKILPNAVFLLTTTSWLEHVKLSTRTDKIIINEKSQVHIYSYNTNRPSL
jgi:hypothetical protein